MPSDAVKQGFFAFTRKGFSEKRDFSEALKIITAINAKPGALCQCVDARLVAGKNHAVHAARLCLEAFRNGENHVQKKELEFLLWISGKRNIENAMRAFGIKGKKEIFVVSASTKSRNEAAKAMKRVCAELNLWHSEKRGKGAKEKRNRGAAKIRKIMEFYGIPERGLEAFPEESRENVVEKLVLEKIALLGLEA